MAEIAKYRVLWVDDDVDIIESFPPYVEEHYNIVLDVATNWDEAEQLLRINFKEYSAIILDAFCKLRKTDLLPNNLFLGQVSPRLSMIFGEKQAIIPWYVLSAGTMDHFDIVRSIIETEERKKMEPLWGEMLYKKESDTRLEDSKNVKRLLSNIEKIAKEKTTNKVLLRHADVFKYLGKEDFVDYTKSRTYILKMLSALYNPEENLGYSYEENPLRHVVEYVFRTANKFGLLPDDCFIDEDHVALQDSSRFLAGITIKCFDSKNKTKINHFKRFVRGAEPIFSDSEAEALRDILNFTNTGSHTPNKERFTIEEDKKEIFFGYALLLCHIIKTFGKYLESHNNREANSSLIEKIDAPVIGDKVNVSTSKDGKVALCSSMCKLSNNYLSKVGEIVEIDSVEVNKEKDSDLYPLFAKVKSPKENDYKKTPKNKTKSAVNESPKVEFITQIPPKESLLNKTDRIVFDQKGKYAMFGAYCILPQEYKKYIGKTVRIIQIEDNPKKKDNGIPYKATKVELVDKEPKEKIDPDKNADAILAGMPSDI